MSATKKVVSKAVDKKTVETGMKRAHQLAVKGMQQVAVPLDLNKALLADSGQGFEEAGRDAYAIPFLVVLQDLSPQTKKKMDGYIEGARPGMIFNSVTRELAAGDKGIWVIPCHWSQVFIEWVPRSKGGGFIAAHAPGDARVGQGIRQKGAGLVLPNGNELMDTRQHYVLAIDSASGRGEGCLLPFKSTGLKISRRWMSQMRNALVEINGRMIEPPMFAFQYHLTVEEGANDQGSWYQLVVGERQRVTDAGLYQQARAFGQAMKSGDVKVNYEELRSSADEEPAPPEDLDDDVKD